MLTELQKETETRMEKTVGSLKRELNTIRTGRASPALLDKIVVDYYGSATPLNQLASISAPEPRLLVIQPWDKNIIGDIEKAILKSDLGLNPNSDGALIRLQIPQLTEERRIDLTKVVRKKAEEARVAIRNIRRDVNEKLKGLEKKGDVSEDDARRIQDKIQQLTAAYIEKVDQVLDTKEKEIMEV
ncbi:MAG: ribosome recycling factor [bacterium]|jgi:ribosome recycling factor